MPSCRQTQKQMKFLAALLLASLLLSVGCSDSVDPEEPSFPDYLRANFDLKTTPEAIPYPDQNVASDDRIALGRLLFFDPILSGDKDVSCATCHHPAFAWGDGRDVSIGVGGIGLGPDRVRGIIGEPTQFLTPRNSPTVLDAAFNRPFEGDENWDGRMFWDGRLTSLEDQARAPIRSADEMRHEAYTAPEALTRVLERLQEVPEYISLFEESFPEVAATVLDQFGPDFEHLVINGDTYSRAVAAYERELCTADSPFDQFVRGNDEALNSSQQRGLELFFKRDCASCHSGAMFSDYDFHVLGVKQGGGGKPQIHDGGDGSDLGRYLSSGAAVDRYAFRTPTLRNIALTAPYFHTGGVGTNGDYQTLRSVIEFHVRGGNDEELPPNQISPLVTPIELDEQQISDLVAFLESLTATRLLSDRVDPTVPASVPSGLTTVPVLPPSLDNNFPR